MVDVVVVVGLLVNQWINENGPDRTTLCMYALDLSTIREIKLVSKSQFYYTWIIRRVLVAADQFVKGPNKL